MKVIERGSTSLSGLRSMVDRVRTGSFAAYQIEQKADASRIGREIEAFIGNDLKPVTVIILKAG